MDVLRILQLGFIIYFFWIDSVFSDEIIPSCFSNNGNSKHVTTNSGEETKLEFPIDFKYSISSSHIIYYKTDCKNEETIANILTKDEGMLTDLYKERGKLDLRNHQVIYTIKNAQIEDTGVYVFRYNVIHFEIYLEVQERKDVQHNTSFKELHDDKQTIIISVILTFLATVLLCIFIVIIYTRKRGLSLFGRRNSKKKLKPIQTNTTNSEDSFESIQLMHHEGLKHRNLEVTEEATRNIEFSVLERKALKEVIKPDLDNFYSLPDSPRDKAEQENLSFTSLPAFSDISPKSLSRPQDTSLINFKTK